MARQYTVYAGRLVGGEPLMTAPMTTIERVFGLHKEGAARAERECASVGFCTLYTHRLFPLGGDAITVTTQVNAPKE